MQGGGRGRKGGLAVETLVPCPSKLEGEPFIANLFFGGGGGGGVRAGERWEGGRERVKGRDKGAVYF